MQHLNSLGRINNMQLIKITHRGMCLQEEMSFTQSQLCVIIYLIKI